MQKHYELRFLFECKNSEEAALESELRTTLAKELQTTKLSLSANEGGFVLATFVGTEAAIDSVTGKIGQDIGDKRPVIRILDELGTQLRCKAYRELAELELRFRSFVNETLIRGIGFSWWQSLDAANVRSSAEEVAKKNRKDKDETTHEIEFTQFEHLLDILFGRLVKWKPDHPLTIGQLQSLFKECGTLEEAKTQLAQWTKQTNIWDEVFAPLFSEKERLCRKPPLALTC